MKFDAYLSENNEYYAKTLADLRNKLRVVQDKLPEAIKSKDFARVAGLATTAESIANKLMILASQVIRA